jgi:hypothetical protein
VLRLCLQTFLCSLLLVPFSLTAGQIVLDFEGFSDSMVLTNQYPGVTFTNTIILTAGISLNEFEFPPYSGVNVASDNDGSMTLTFASSITSFGGYFTYAEPLRIDAFNAANAIVASATSTFSNNEALSGDLGSSPDEFIQVSFASGISSVTITGDPLGGSFVIDNATYTTAGTGVPEPSSWTLFALSGGLLALCWFVAPATPPSPPVSPGLTTHIRCYPFYTLEFGIRPYPMGEFTDRRYSVSFPSSYC